MSEENIVRYSLEDLPEDTRTDWERVDALTDEEIEQAVREDPDQELLDDAWFERAQLVRPGDAPPGSGYDDGEHGREQVTMQVDRDVMAFFEKHAEGDAEAQMHAVLKAHVRRERSDEGSEQARP
jgi:uncharacterized protein (DUF4415 family)